MTRRTLLSRLRDLGDDEGWREFFDTYWRFIYNVAHKAGLSDADAQDLVQDVLVSLTKKMPGFHYDPARGKFKAFLMLVVRSRLAEFWRNGAQARERTVPLNPEAVDNASASADLELVWDEEWRRTMRETALERVQRQVSARQFLIFDLAIVRQRPVEEITRALEINVAQVYMAKMRVKRLVEKELRKLDAQ